MIQAKYILNQSEFVRAGIEHFSSQPKFRVGMPIFGIAAILGAIVMSFSAPDLQTGVIAGLPILLVGSFLLCFKHFVCWQLQRQFRALPSRNSEILWSFSEAELRAVGRDFQFSQSWNSVVKCIESPIGLLVYPQKGLFYWIPSHAFSKNDFGQVCELAKAKVNNFTKRH